MSRHESRQKLAREFGATDVVSERGEEGIARIKELTNGVGADSVMECVGTKESMQQAIQVNPAWRIRVVRWRSARRGTGRTALFFAHVHLHGGPAPVRRYLPHLMDIVLNEKINPGKVFDLTCRSNRSQRATVRWTSVEPSRRCCGRDAERKNDNALGER